MTFAQAMDRSIRVMATVCGWVILFRTIIAYLERWFLWMIPSWGQVLVKGTLELANGCCSLMHIESEAMRFVIASGLLSIGGICVAMQTASVSEKLGMGLYLPGKLLQTLLSIILAGITQYFLYPHAPLNAVLWCILAGVLAGTLVIIMKFPKKEVAFPKKMVYNREKDCTEVGKCSFGSGW